MAAASRMIVGQVPMLNKDAKATVKDMIAISPDLLGRFLALVKGSINESIKVASAPLEDMQGISFDSENELYQSYLKTGRRVVPRLGGTPGTTGIGGRMI